MEGMLKAAETKSTSDENEKYLKSKATISCLVILFDQLQNLTKEAKKDGDLKTVQKLQKKQKAIKKELMKAQDDMRENILRTDLKWKEENGINEFQAINMVESARIETGNHRIVEDESKKGKSIIVVGSESHPEVEGIVSYATGPVHVIDSPEKAKKKAWNDRYNEALENGDQETINEMNLEALRRIEKYDFPDPASLQKYDMNTLFRFHPAEYLEKFMNMPQFIKAHQKEGDPIKQYIEEHPVLKRKIEFMNVMCDYMTESLMSAHIAVANGEYSRFDHTISKGRFQEYSGKLRTAYQNLDQAVGNELQEKEKNEPQVQTAAEKKAEYDQLRQENPLFTKENFKVYKGFLEANKVLLDPGYQQINEQFLRKWNAEHKKNWVDDVSRTFGAMLRAVHLDKNGNPVKEIDQKRKAQNDRWMNSWVEKENESAEEKQQREAVQTEIIQKEAKTLFKGFDFPEPQDLMKWIKDMLKKKPFAFCEMMKRSLAVDKLAEINPVMREYRDSNLVFKQKLNVMSALNRMIPNITRAYFGFDCNAAGGAEIVTDERQREAKTSFEDRSDGESLLDVHVAEYEEAFNRLRPLQVKERQDDAEAAQKNLDDIKTRKAQYKQSKVNADGE